MRTCHKKSQSEWHEFLNAKSTKTGYTPYIYTCTQWNDKNGSSIDIEKGWKREKFKVLMGYEDIDIAITDSQNHCGSHHVIDRHMQQFLQKQERRKRSQANKNKNKNGNNKQVFAADANTNKKHKTKKGRKKHRK